MSREDVNHPTSQAFRLRDATRNIYHHTQEQLFRARSLVTDLPPGDPLHTEWLQLSRLLADACDQIKWANDLAHIIGSRGAAFRGAPSAPASATEGRP